MTTTEPTPEFSHNPESELAQKISAFVETHAVILLDDESQRYGRYFFTSEESPVLDGDELIVARSMRSTARGLYDDVLLRSPEGKVHLHLAVGPRGHVSIDGTPYDHGEHAKYADFVAFLGTDQLEPDTQTEQARREREAETDIYEMFRIPLQDLPDSGRTP